MREFLSSLSKVEYDKVRLRIGGYLQTPMGNDHLVSLGPRSDEAWIRAELALTSEMKGLVGEGTPVPIRGLADVRTALQRAAIVDFVLPAADLLAIAHLAANSRELKTFFSGRAKEYPGLAGLILPLTIDKIIEYNILRAIDEEGRVTDGASQALGTIRRAIRRKNEALRSQMESILGNLHKKGITQEELITTRDGRLVIPVRSEYKNQVPGFIHSISASGATAFIEPTQTLEMNNDLRTLESQEHQEIAKILKELTAQVRDADTIPYGEHRGHRQDRFPQREGPVLGRDRGKRTAAEYREAVQTERRHPSAPPLEASAKRDLPARTRGGGAFQYADHFGAECRREIRRDEDRRTPGGAGPVRVSYSGIARF